MHTALRVPFSYVNDWGDSLISGKYFSICFTLSLVVFLMDLVYPPANFEAPSIGDRMANSSILYWIWNRNVFEQTCILIFSTMLCLEIHRRLGYWGEQWTLKMQLYERIYVPWTIIGIIMSVTGFSLRLWAKITLGDLFTYQITQPTQLITSGPYYYFIHPGYIGAILQAFSLAIQVFPDVKFISPTLRVVLATFIIVIILATINIRIQDEEELLENHFGKKLWTEHKNSKWI